MAEKEKSKTSFRDTILIVFVVILCFGLTVYGIVYLTGKVFSNEEKIEIAKLQEEKVSTNPENGDVLTFTSEEEKPIIEEETQVEVEENTEKPRVIVGNKITDEAKKEEQVKSKEVVKEKKVEPAKKQVEKKQEPKVEKKQPEKQVAKIEEKKPAKSMQSKGAFVVQIMAVKSMKDAEKEANKYKSVCRDVFIQKADLGAKGTWYRIRCGASNSKAEVTKMRDLIKQKFKGTSPQVVSNK